MIIRDYEETYDPFFVFGDNINTKLTNLKTHYDYISSQSFLMLLKIVVLKRGYLSIAPPLS